VAFVQFTGVSLAFGARDILKEAGLFLQAGTKAALAGPNGAGKSTLLKIVAGELQPDSGSRAVSKGARVAYLPQSGADFRGRTLESELETAFDEFAELEARRDGLGRELELSREDGARTKRLLEEFHELQEAIERSGYYRRRAKVAEVCSGLGFREGDYSRPVEEFSGGWQMRVALAKTLLRSPDVMLLDEPTNYLDIEARSWLEDYLRAYEGGFVIVSHDRYFLDVTVREVYELFNGKLSRYPGTYSAYEDRRRQELDTLLASWERQQEEIAKLEDFIRRFRYNESKAAMVQSRIKQLDKIEPIEIPEGMKRIHFSFPKPPHSGRIALELDGLRKSYGDRLVVDDLSLTIEAGMKVAFVGRNGAGKSTLMRLIAGVDVDFEGVVRWGTGIKAAYFAQDVADTLEGSGTVEESVEEECPFDLIPQVRNMLGAFLFRGDDVKKPVKVLSGGERSRLALLKMLLHPANLLVLDEPTNHLDLNSKDVLLDALKRFEGTVLFVSHDRYFIDELATHVLELECGSTPRYFPGGYSYYLEKKARDAATGGASGDAGIPLKGERDDADAGKSSWEGDKQRKARARKLKRAEEEVLARLEAIGAERARAQSAMAMPENYVDGAKMKALGDSVDALDAEAARLNEEWERIVAELEGEG
jgi:ATP-binding cassette subfamily F protein 3